MAVVPWSTKGGGGSTISMRLEAQRIARGLLESNEYRSWLTDRIAKKTLSEGMERLLWSYAYGTPLQQVQVSVSESNVDYSKMSTNELMHQLDSMRDAVREMEALEQAIPAQYKTA